MPRGGAREGAGRPGIDWAKKVDVRLTQAQLDTLDAYRALYEVEDHKGDPRPLSRPEALRHLIDVHAAADVAEGGLR